MSLIHVGDTLSSSSCERIAQPLTNGRTQAPDCHCRLTWAADSRSKGQTCSEKLAEAPYRLAEAHGNRTHPPNRNRPGTTVLKTARGTSPRALPGGS